RVLPPKGLTSWGQVYIIHYDSLVAASGVRPTGREGQAPPLRHTARATKGTAIPELMASARFLRAGGLEAAVAGLAVEVGGPAAIASDAVSLLVRGGEVVAALAVSALAGLVEEAGRLRGVLRDTGSLRVDRGGVEAAEGVSALAAELRELPALRP